MLKIVLLSAAGMSTSMLVKKMQEAAKAKGLEAEIAAYPESQLAKVGPTADVILLGPQIRFALKKITAEAEKFNVPVDVIPPADYGMMNGVKVLALAEKIAAAKK